MRSSHTANTPADPFETGRSCDLYNDAVIRLVLAPSSALFAHRGPFILNEVLLLMRSLQGGPSGQPASRNALVLYPVGQRISEKKRVTPRHRRE